MAARRMTVGTLLILAYCLSPAGAAPASFTDPAPPRAVQQVAADAGHARPNTDVTFHHAPKPLPADAATADWPSFQGPTHNAFTPENKLLDRFPAGGPALVWEMKKGEGYAQPLVVGERLILFHRVGDDEVVECLDAQDGKRLWRFAYPTNYMDRYGYCNGPRGTPVVANGQVFAIGAQGKLHCLDLQTGQLHWQRDLMKEFKLRQNFFGVGSSPLVEGGLLIVNVGADNGPCVAAFDVRTGRMAWGAGDQWGPSYASPVPAMLHGKRRVLVFAGGESRPPTGGLLCINPANGHVDFSFRWRGNRRESVNAASPVAVANQVFISECYGAGSALLDVREDLAAAPTWTNPDFGIHFMTAIPKDGYLYGVDGHGPEDAFLCCIDLKTGKEVWRKQPEWEETTTTRDGTQRKLTLGAYRCNLLMTGTGRCLCLGEYGHLLWLDLSPAGYRELDRAWLFPAGESWTPPVLSKGLLYVCQNAQGNGGEPMRLMCYDLRATH